jgi:hypothetical protein
MIQLISKVHRMRWEKINKRENKQKIYRQKEEAYPTYLHNLYRGATKLISDPQQMKILQEQ